MTALALAPKLEPGITGFHAWRKALWNDDRLRQIARDARKAARGRNPSRPDIRSVADVFAMQGENGRGCFATGETVAALIGCDRKTIHEYRKTLIELGWFTLVSSKGGRTGRAMIINISLPAGQALKLHCPEHGSWLAEHGPECPVCKARQVRRDNPELFGQAV
jgi:Helix-turn-helix domain